MNKYYIKFGISKNCNAGSKAIRDIMFLLESKDYKAVLALPTGVNKLFKLIDIPILFLTLLFRVRKNGIILYIVPSNFRRIRFLKFIRRIIGFKLVCFINDVESLRMGKPQEYARLEIESISCADIVLAPNENSIRILQNEYNLTNHLIPVGVWDYLNNHEHVQSNSTIESTYHQQSVAFAGNLQKSSFIKELHLVHLNFKIWGSGREKRHKDNIDFMGSETPDKLIGSITECSWGLVWDGDSIHSCSGLMGSYLRFNNSHKCGLYLCAGIPVIVWCESGMASFVLRHRVGICVSSLQEAAEIISQMNEETYCMYQRNAQSVAQSISKGKFFLQALNKAEKLKIE